MSFAVSKRFEKHSLDVKHLARKGNVLPVIRIPLFAAHLKSMILVKKDYLIVDANQDLENVAELLAHSDQVIFGVVNQENDLQGQVYFNYIR